MRLEGKRSENEEGGVWLGLKTSDDGVRLEG